MVKFRVFNFRETMQVEVTEKGFFGGETRYTKSVKRFATTNQLYEAVAEFATSLGHRLINISGTPWSDVVVWYHEE